MNVWVESFLDGFTGAGLFGRLRRPGAPVTLIAESRVDLSGPVRNAFRKKMGVAMGDLTRLRENARLEAEVKRLLDLASARNVTPARHGT